MVFLTWHMYLRKIAMKKWGTFCLGLVVYENKVNILAPVYFVKQPFRVPYSNITNQLFRVPYSIAQVYIVKQLFTLPYSKLWSPLQFSVLGQTFLLTFVFTFYSLNHVISYEISLMLHCLMKTLTLNRDYI